MDLMLDIETLGTSPGCVVLSVAAVKFDPGPGPAKRETVLHATLSIADQLRVGLGVDRDTQDFWRKQDEKVWLDATADPDDPADVIGALRHQIRAGEFTRIWTQGAAFDIPILDEAARRLTGESAVKDFWRVRDTRTLYDVASMLTDFDRHELDAKRTGAHNAAADCYHQIGCVRAALGALHTREVKNNEA